MTYQPIGTDFGALSAVSVFQSLNKLSPLVANKKIRPLFIYNYICIILKKWPYFFDSGTLSAIFEFQSLNKLGPLVADFKIPMSGPAGPPKDQLTQVSCQSDKFRDNYPGVP